MSGLEASLVMNATRLNTGTRKLDSNPEQHYWEVLIRSSASYWTGITCPPGSHTSCMTDLFVLGE